MATSIVPSPPRVGAERLGEVGHGNGLATSLDLDRARAADRGCT